MDPLKPGALVGGFRVLELIGKGGMGAVYRAEQVSLNRAVALKVLFAGDDHSSRAVLRFLREMELHGALSHPHIAHVFDGGVEGGLPYLAMELVEGTNLRSVLQLGGPLSPRAALEVACAVLKALAYLHARGVVHRDVKPANVMIMPGGVVKLVDLGLGRSERERDQPLTETGEVVGTPRYLAPESIRGKPASTAADVHAVGVLIHDMLTLEFAFGDGDLAAIVRGIVEMPPRQLARALAGVPPALEGIVARMLDKEPERRPSADRALYALRKLMHGDAVDAMVLRGAAPSVAEPGLSRDVSTSVLTQARASGGSDDAPPGTAPLARSSRAPRALAAALLFLALGAIGFVFSRVSTRSDPAPWVSLSPAPRASAVVRKRAPAEAAARCLAHLAQVDAAVARHRAAVTADPTRRRGDAAGLLLAPALRDLHHAGVEPARDAVDHLAAALRDAVEDDLRGPPWLDLNHAAEQVVEAARLAGAFERGSPLRPHLAAVERALPPRKGDPYRTFAEVAIRTRIELWTHLTFTDARKRVDALVDAMGGLMTAEPAHFETPRGRHALIWAECRMLDRWPDTLEEHAVMLLPDHAAGFLERRASLRRLVALHAGISANKIRKLESTLTRPLFAELAYHLVMLLSTPGEDDDTCRRTLKALDDVWPFVDRALWPRTAAFAARLEVVGAVNRRLKWVVAPGVIERHLQEFPPR